MKYVRIRLDEFKNLTSAMEELIALSNAGVDNWSGCDFAYEEFEDPNDMSDKEFIQKYNPEIID